MKDDCFEIDIDRRQLLVRLKLSGIWDIDTVDRYAVAAQAAFSELTGAGVGIASCRALIDLRRHGVQPREVTERIQGWLNLALSDGARHAVLLSESALHRMQAQRVGSAFDAAFFSDETEALDWLSQGVDVIQAG